MSKDDSLDKAQQLYEQGKWKEALRVLNRAIMVWPTDERLYCARAILYFKLNQYSRAIEDLTKTIALNPGFRRGSVHELRGKTYFELGEFNRAINDLTIAIETAPAEPYVHFIRGICRIKMRCYREAIADFLLLLPYSQYEDCALLALGDINAEVGEYEYAIEYYSRLVNEGSFCAWICLRRAMAYEKSGNFKAAMDDYARLVGYYSGLIEDNPTRGWVYSARGHILEKMGRSHDAIMDYKRAERL